MIIVAVVKTKQKFTIVFVGRNVFFLVKSRLNPRIFIVHCMHQTRKFRLN